MRLLIPSAIMGVVQYITISQARFCKVTITPWPYWVFTLNVLTTRYHICSGSSRHFLAVRTSSLPPIASSGNDSATRELRGWWIRSHEFHGCYWHKHSCRTDYDPVKWNKVIEREEELLKVVTKGRFGVTYFWST